MEKELKPTPNLRKTLVLLLAIAVATLAASCAFKPSGDDVAASVDGQKIYRADVEKYFQNQTAGSPQPLSDEQATSLRLSILRELIENEILMHRAAKLGLLATDDEVDRKLNEIKSPYGTEEFTRKLQERKFSLDDFNRHIRRTLTADKVLHKEITSKINVSQQDIAGYYAQHQAEFNPIQPRYHLARILVTTSTSPQGQSGGNKARKEAEARQKNENDFGRPPAGAGRSRAGVIDSPHAT